MKSEPKSAWHRLVDYVLQVVGLDDSPAVDRTDGQQSAGDEGRRIGFPEKMPAFAKIPR
jgi:hypothetical protein